jgi:hypothetical protein
METATNKRIIQNLFRYYFSRHSDIKLPLKDLKAAEAIMQCRTTERGYNLLSCPQGHGDKIQTHSCRHRSCPLCAERSRYDWIEQEKRRLIACPHFHVIFTLPHEYLTLWAYNRKWFTRHLFKACRDTLLELLADPRYLGAKPGILMTLHTWGRQLNYHPHLHCLVSAGGVTSGGEWKHSGDYLLPIRVVKALYRGKLQAWIKDALLAGELILPRSETQASLLTTHRQLFRKPWSVRIQEKYDHGRGVALYLARYLKGGPVKPGQLQATGKGIELTYRDHRDQRRKVVRLTLDEFVRRLLWHVPEGGVHVVRHYGLYAGRSQACRAALPGHEEAGGRQSAGQLLKDAVNWCCDQCGAPLQRTYTTYQRRDNENSFNKEASAKIVQQEVQVGTLKRPQPPPREPLWREPYFFH